MVKLDLQGMANYCSPEVVEKIVDWLTDFEMFISSQSLNFFLFHLLSSVVTIRTDLLSIS